MEIDLLMDSLKDINNSEIKVLQGFCLKQREENKTRIGLIKFYSAIYLILENEKRQRKVEAQRITNNLIGAGEVAVSWEGKNIDK